eukprot:766239-Hanusia_phi.AAC.1
MMNQGMFSTHAVRKLWDAEMEALRQELKQAKDYAQQCEDESVELRRQICSLTKENSQLKVGLPTRDHDLCLSTPQQTPMDISGKKTRGARGSGKRLPSSASLACRAIDIGCTHGYSGGGDAFEPEEEHEKSWATVSYEAGGPVLQEECFQEKMRGGEGGGGTGSAAEMETSVKDSKRKRRNGEASSDESPPPASEENVQGDGLPKTASEQLLLLEGLKDHTAAWDERVNWMKMIGDVLEKGKVEGDET